MGVFAENFEKIRDLYIVDGIDRSMYINDHASKRIFDYSVYELADNDFPVLEELLFLRSKNIQPGMRPIVRKLIMVSIELQEKKRIENNPRVKKNIKQIEAISSCPFTEVDDDIIAIALDGKYGSETKYTIGKRARLVRIENTLKELPVQEYSELSNGDLLNVIIDARRGYAYADIPYELIPKSQDGDDYVTRTIKNYFTDGAIQKAKDQMRSTIHAMQKDQEWKYYSPVKVKKSSISRGAFLYLACNGANIHAGLTTHVENGMKTSKYGWIYDFNKKRLASFFTEFLVNVWDMSFLT